MGLLLRRLLCLGSRAGSRSWKVAGSDFAGDFVPSLGPEQHDLSAFQGNAKDGAYCLSESR